jgi:hypothetical protein
VLPERQRISERGPAAAAAHSGGPWQKRVHLLVSHSTGCDAQGGEALERQQVQKRPELLPTSPAPCVHTNDSMLQELA